MAEAVKDKADNNSVTDPIDELLHSQRDVFVTKMEELRPQHEAYVKLAAIVENFDKLASGELPRQPRRRGTTGTGTRAGRGSRPDEFLAVIRDAGTDGITVAEATEKMEGVNQNYLYRIAKDLTNEDLIRKEGKRYIIAAAS